MSHLAVIEVTVQTRLPLNYLGITGSMVPFLTSAVQACPLEHTWSS